MLEARWDGERTDRAHRYVLDPAILAHRFVRPFPDQDTRIRNRPSLVDLFVQLLEDLLLGAVIDASRNVDVGDGHVCLLSWPLALRTWWQLRLPGSLGYLLISPKARRPGQPRSGGRRDRGGRHGSRARDLWVR